MTPTTTPTELTRPTLSNALPRGGALRTIGRGSLDRIGVIHVLRVAGSDYDMGYQHGVLLAEEIRRGPIPYYRRMLDKLLGKGALGAISPIVLGGLQATIGRRVSRRIPPFALDVLHGVADGAGIERSVFLEGCTMPDSMMWVVSRLMQLKGDGPAVAHRIALELGCTSAVAWGGATKDGELLHARNFDYHGVSCWPSTKTVIFHEPDEGHRYVSVAAAGVALGGITAMNDQGLSLTVHQHMFTDRVRLGGVPIGIVGDLVMREASSLDEAEAILRAHTPIGCWTYVVTDARAREVLCFEESPDRQAARRVRVDEETFGYANIYLDETLGRTEVDLYGSYWRHNAGRHRAVRERLSERHGSLDPQGMAEILGDTGHSDCRVRDSIAMVMTVASVVFRPIDGTVWVGTGEAPTSHGTFVPFRIASAGYEPTLDFLEVGAETPQSERAAFERFRRTYVSYVDDGSLDRALEEIGHACDLAPGQPLYHALRGLLSLNAVRADDAEDALDRAIALGHPDPERVASFHLWRGRARDVQGRREDAVTDYRAALGRKSDPPVRRAAIRSLRRPYRAADAARVHVDVGLADVVQP
ncbi:MAG: C45 family autoproteolytic acyltransferase/hydrolase [Sandaracinaceae bacterium]